MEYIPEISLVATITYICILQMMPVKAYITMDTDKISFVGPFNSKDGNYYLVRCKDANFIRNFVEYIKIQSINKIMNNGLVIGIIYFDENNNIFRFEDKLVIERINGLTNENLASHETNEYVIVTNGFLPFAIRPWLIIEENIQFNDFKQLIVNHYNACNFQSLRKQVQINYDRSEHFKFALMDQMIRMSKYINPPDNCKGAVINGILDSHYIFAIEKMKENGLVEDPNNVQTDCQLTYSGHRAFGFGFDQACEYNRNKRSEKWLDFKSNILPIIISATALIVSFVSLVHSLSIP